MPYRKNDKEDPEERPNEEAENVFQEYEHDNLNLLSTFWPKVIMIQSLFITFEGINDNKVLNLSGIETKIKTI